MNAVAVTGAAAVFCFLQAVYWIARSRKARREALLLERLGTDESLAQANSLLRGGGEDAGILQPLVTLLEQAGEEPQLGPFFTRVAMSFLGMFAFIVLITQSLGGGLFFGLAASGIPYLLLQRKKRMRVARVEQQLPEALEVMSISLRAGQSLDQTIRLTAQELDAPIGEEFQRVAEECGLGRSLDEALLAMSNRLTTARTVRTFVTSVLVLRQTGGNLIEVLESIIDTMRQQAQYERKLASMTSEGRSSARMLAALPPLFAMFAYLGDPTYVGRMFTDPLGQVMALMAVGFYVTGLLWVRRLVNPKGAS